MAKYLDDIFILLGGLLIMIGFYYFWLPGIFFTAGLLLISLGIMTGFSNRKPIEKRKE